MDKMYFCVIGIEMGMTCASNVEIIATFSTYDKAKHFINNKKYRAIYTLVDILETYIDTTNIGIQNFINLN